MKRSSLQYLAFRKSSIDGSIDELCLVEMEIVAQRVEPSLFPSQLLAVVWSSALVLVDLITFHPAGLPESHPGPAPWLSLCFPFLEGWLAPAEHILVLSGGAFCFSASRFNNENLLKVSDVSSEAWGSGNQCLCHYHRHMLRVFSFMDSIW